MRGHLLGGSRKQGMAGAQGVPQCVLGPTSPDTGAQTALVPDDQLPTELFGERHLSSRLGQDQGDSGGHASDAATSPELNGARCDWYWENGEIHRLKARLFPSFVAILGKPGQDLGSPSDPAVLRRFFWAFSSALSHDLSHRKRAAAIISLPSPQ